MVVVVLVLSANLACSDSPASGNKTHATQITVGDNYFNPTDATIAPGDTVIWIWGGAAGHNVIFTTSGAPTDCGTISSGVCIRAFGTATGTFNYVCSLHAGMIGSIKVQ